jgi:hypothetical protein
MTIKSLCTFSFEHYGDIMKHLLQNGHEFVFFTEQPQTDRFVYLRHDVDRSLDKALALALWERELGIKSTYFVRVHSRYYNCYSFPGLKALRTIMHAGHEIGLHTEFYDLAKVFGDDGSAVFAREKRILEEILERPIQVFSPHRTTGSTSTGEIREHLTTLRDANNMLCTFDERFQSDVKYLSDSSGIWREGCPCGYLDLYPRLQLLVHPIWWYREHIELEDPIL